MCRYCKDHINGAEDFSFPGCFLADKARTMIVCASNLYVGNGLKEMIYDLNLLRGHSTLIKLNRYRPCIVCLVEFKIFPELCRNNGSFPSEKFYPDRGIYKDWACVTMWGF